MTTTPIQQWTDFFFQRRHNKTVPAETRTAIERMIGQMIDADPSPDQRYMPAMLRWFMFHLNEIASPTQDNQTETIAGFTAELDRARTVLALYQANPNHFSAPASARTGGTKGALAGFPTLTSFEAEGKKAVAREAKAQAGKIDAAKRKMEGLIKAGHATEIQVDGDFRFFKIADQVISEFNYRDHVILTPNGDTYSISFPVGDHVLDIDSNYPKTRTVFPDFFKVTLEYARQLAAQGSTNALEIYCAQSTTPEWRGLVSVETAAAQFKAKHILDQGDPGREQQYSGLIPFELTRSFEMLAREKGISRYLSASDVRKLFERAMGHDALNDAQRILGHGMQRKEWRRAFGIEDAYNLVTELGHKEVTYSMKDMAIAHLLTNIARNAFGRNQSSVTMFEIGEYLPRTLEYLSNPKRPWLYRQARSRRVEQKQPGRDWGRIRTLLIYADRFEPWRRSLELQDIQRLRDIDDPAKDKYRINEILDRFKTDAPRRERVPVIAPKAQSLWFA